MKLPIGVYTIRSFTMEDVPSLVEQANNRNVAATLRDRFPNPYTESAAREWIGSTLGREPETAFAIADGPVVIGGIGLGLREDVYARSGEIGYWLGEPFWGKGIITSAVRAFTGYVFDNFDLVRIYAAVFETNPASVRVLEKAGYSFEGRLRQAVFKNGLVQDELMYSILREEWKGADGHEDKTVQE